MAATNTLFKVLCWNSDGGTERNRGNLYHCINRFWSPSPNKQKPEALLPEINSSSLILIYIIIPLIFVQIFHIRLPLCLSLWSYNDGASILATSLNVFLRPFMLYDKDMNL
jgi:hypothetical protein